MRPVLNSGHHILEALESDKQTDENIKNSKYFIIMSYEEKLKKLWISMAE